MATQTTTPDENVVVDLPDETTIVVVDDTPEADKGRVPSTEKPADVTDEELTQYSSQKLKDRLAHLGKGYHDERRAKESATRERDEAVRVAQQIVAENQRLQGSLSSNQNMLLEQAKRSVATEIEEAKREYREAQEKFDTEGIVNAQEKLTAAKIRADKVNSYRPPPAPPPVQHVQPVVQQQQRPVVDEKTQDWQANNKWFGANRKMTAYALSLHEDLVESGVPVASDSYYSAINTDMKKRFPEAFEGPDAEAPPSQRNRSNVVAPASRSTAPRKIVLSPTQVSLAKQLGLSLEVYARSVAEEMRK